MPTFSAASHAQLLTCVTPLQLVCVEVIKHFDFTVLEGHRGQAAQDAAFASGASQKRWPFGEHNATPSRAVDIWPFPIDWSDQEKNVQRCVLLAGMMLATGWHLGIRLRWGGDWNRDGDTRNEHFRDYGHIEVDP